MPRRPTPLATVAVCKALIAEGHTDREVTRRSTAAGHPVSNSTVQNIRHGRRPFRRPNNARLNPGERRLDPPQRCDAGHLITVAPCRTCAAHRALLIREDPPIDSRLNLTATDETAPR